MTQDPLKLFAKRDLRAALLRGKKHEEPPDTQASQPDSQRRPTYLDGDAGFVRDLDVLHDLLQQGEAPLQKLLHLGLRNKCASLRQWRAAGGFHGHEAAQGDGCERERSEGDEEKSRRPQLTMSPSVL